MGAVSSKFFQLLNDGKNEIKITKTSTFKIEIVREGSKKNKKVSDRILDRIKNAW